MKKIFLTVAGLALMSSSNAWAIAGGPFDNGDVGGVLTERGGFYQCQFSFRNGNGYGIFTPDSFLGGNLPNPNQQVGTNNQQLGIFNRGSLYTPNTGINALSHNANRSVFYHQGVSYVGGCFGFIDHEKKRIEGVCNGSSNENITQQTLSQNTGGLINASQVAATSQSLVINDSANILNLGWKGKITDYRPSMRFRGKGEMSIAEAGQNVKAIAAQAYQGLIDAIISSVGNSNPPANYQVAQQAINDALDDLQSRLNDPTGQKQFVKVKVFGNRRFF